MQALLPLRRGPRAPWPATARATLAACAACAVAALLAACGGGLDAEDHDAHDHRNTFIDTAGRIATIESGAATLRVHDLDSGSVEASPTLDHVPSAVYASPGGRYAVVMQRLQDQVQFVDGGIWQEDHVDHLHDYRQASRLMPWRLAGSRPTHYDVQAGRQAAVFMDGNAAATPAVPAGVRLLTDASIAAGALVAGLDLTAPIHGLGEPVDDKLLTAARAEDAADTLPTHLTLWLRSGATWNLVRQLPTRCNGMHGSFSAGGYTVAGCREGLLVVRHDSATEVSERMAATPLRLGTVAGHPRLGAHFIGIGNDGAAPAPVTTRFFALDAAAGSAVEWVPQGWTAGRLRRAHGFDRSGQRVFVLDDQGTLVVAQFQAGAWAPLARVTGAVPAMPSAAPWPAFTANGARDEVYLTDPVARQLVVVDSLTGAVKARRDLGFVPSGAAWLGITR
jgi:hypothetical protein